VTEKVKYFEDLQVGYRWFTDRRKVTENDIVTFAKLSGDFNPLHMDEGFAKKTLFGKRIAHGLLGLSICSGLPSKEPPWLILAFMGLDWKFTKPIFIGDEIFCESEVSKVRELGKGDRGIVMMDRKLKNQNDEVVQEGSFTLLLQKRS
jgi:acyl dehydratase